MVKTPRKSRRLTGGAVTGLAVALAAAPAPVAAAPPPASVSAVVDMDGRSVTFKSDFAEAHIDMASGRPVLHILARSSAIGAIFTADLPVAFATSLTGPFPLGPAQASRAMLQVPRRAADFNEQRFALTEGAVQINSYSLALKTISGNFAATGVTLSGSTPIEITHGVFFNVPVK